jgi:hypothetical protein
VNVSVVDTHFDVAKLTNLALVYEPLFPNLVLKISSFVVFALKSLSKICASFLRN